MGIDQHLLSLHDMQCNACHKQLAKQVDFCRSLWSAVKPDVLWPTTFEHIKLQMVQNYTYRAVWWKKRYKTEGANMVQG